MQPCVCSGLRSFVPPSGQNTGRALSGPPPPDGTTSLPPKKFQGKRRSSGTPPTERTFAGEAPRCGLPDKRYPPRRTNSIARLPRTLLPHSRRFAPYIPNEHPARHAPGRTSAPPPRRNAVKPDRAPATSLLCFRCTHFVRKRSEIAEMRSRHRAAANSFASRPRHIVSRTGLPPAPASGNRSSRNGFSNPGRANLIRTSLRNIPNVFPPTKTTKRLLRSIARPETPDAPQRPAPNNAPHTFPGKSILSPHSDESGSARENEIAIRHVPRRSDRTYAPRPTRE